MNKEIFEKSLKEFIYELNKEIKITEYYESKICEPKEKTTYKSKNYIKYYTRDTKTVVSEINIKYEIGEGRTRRTIQQFNGIFFINKIKSKIIEKNIFIESKRMGLNFYSSKEFYFMVFLLTIMTLRMPIKWKILIFGIVIFIMFIGRYFKRLEKEYDTVKFNYMFNKYFYINGDKDRINKIIKSDIIEEFIKFEKKSKIKVHVSIIKNKVYMQFSNVKTLYENNFGKCFSKKIIECVEFNNSICDILDKNSKENRK